MTKRENIQKQETVRRQLPRSPTSSGIFSYLGYKAGHRVIPRNSRRRRLFPEDPSLHPPSTRPVTFRPIGASASPSAGDIYRQVRAERGEEQGHRQMAIKAPGGFFDMIAIQDARTPRGPGADQLLVVNHGQDRRRGSSFPSGSTAAPAGPIHCDELHEPKRS